MQVAPDAFDHGRIAVIELHQGRRGGRDGFPVRQRTMPGSVSTAGTRVCTRTGKQPTSRLYLRDNGTKGQKRMPRARIVLETSNQRKSAMMEAASLQGATLVDWLEEHIDTAGPCLSSRITEPTSEIGRVDELEDTEAIFTALSSRDWSFTDEDTRFLTHDLHPYPAKFIPQIPANLIARLSMPGDLVLDPFGGSATTAVEAVRLGRRAISFDANPLSALIGRVKTGFMTSSIHADLEQLSAVVEGHIIGSTEQRRIWAKSLASESYLPPIPNIEKWFNKHVIEELRLLRHLIDQTTDGVARDTAYLALSRITIRVSNQESETRYVSVAKKLPPSLTLKAYLESLKALTRRLETVAQDLQFADARFLTGDSRFDLPGAIGENSIDLIVTSPPYPNATDYHLYHRFRLFWLGFDPRKLGKIEIGSHLRHQRNNTGFEEYQHDMRHALEGCAAVLSPGRYAVFVVGDALFKGEYFSTSDSIQRLAQDVGLRVIGTIDRPLHPTRRSFAKPARRARSEQLVLLRKPNNPVRICLNPPTYRMWTYEHELRARETETLLGTSVPNSFASRPMELRLRQPALWQVRRLTFTKDFEIGGRPASTRPTWQCILENGRTGTSKRKDPKYVTHGLHAFKGKFYPQLAKSLINISGIQIGDRLLDPYCGSGTTLLEGMLNGLVAYGCDYNPLSAKIAHAKTSILSVPRNFIDLSIRTIFDRLSHRHGKIPVSLDQFASATHEELLSWFPEIVLYKLNWLLAQVRLFGSLTMVDFFEVIISDIIREVSYQDPSDLRIRRRKEAMDDAPVFEMFRERLELHHARLLRYWSVASQQPGPLISPTIVQGDSRRAETMQALGLGQEHIDCVVTSPPYATALPYIDTDRLSLLAIMGISSRARSDLEANLTGSREIRRSERRDAEARLLDESAFDTLPPTVVTAIRNIHTANSSIEVGFRRANMAALLWRYFLDMRENLIQVTRVMKLGAKAFYVVGDSRTKAGGCWISIKTCAYMQQIAEMIGLRKVDMIDIDVTTENFKHIKNAITRNKVIILEKI